MQRCDFWLRFCVLALCFGCGAARSSASRPTQASGILASEILEEESIPSASTLAQYDRAIADASHELGLVSDESDGGERNAAPPALAQSETRRAQERERYVFSDDGVDEDVRAENPCIRRCRLVALVCELSERMCRIAYAHPEMSELAPRCDRGRTRCDEARNQTNACSCAQN